MRKLKKAIEKGKGIEKKCKDEAAVEAAKRTNELEALRASAGDVEAATERATAAEERATAAEERATAAEGRATAAEGRGPRRRV